MPEKTEAQKKAQKKYMEKFTVARIRMVKENYVRMQEHAKSMGESINGFVNRAVVETINKDNSESR